MYWYSTCLFRTPVLIILRSNTWHPLAPHFALRFRQAVGARGKEDATWSPQRQVSDAGGTFDNRYQMAVPPIDFATGPCDEPLLRREDGNFDDRHRASLLQIVAGNFSTPAATARDQGHSMTTKTCYGLPSSWVSSWMQAPPMSWPRLHEDMFLTSELSVWDKMYEYGAGSLNSLWGSNFSNEYNPTAVRFEILNTSDIVHDRGNMPQVFERFFPETSISLQTSARPSIR
jgi:hypothetical protein